MSAIIRGVEYPTSDPGAIKTGTMVKVKKATGYGWGVLFRFVNRDLPRMPGAEELMLADLLSEEKFLAYLFAFVVDQGGDLKWSDFQALTAEDVQLVPDEKPPESVEEEPADPTPASGLADSDQDADAAAAPQPRKPSTRASSTTRKPRSTPRSR